jgi:hypothetical protein
MDMFFDLGAMSDAKEDLVKAAMKPIEHDCTHPLTSHTGTEATWPWKVCAHRPCPCKILVD